LNRVATFFTHSHHAVELDWSIPLIIEFAKTTQVQIICTNIFSFEGTLYKKFPMIKGNKNISIIYLDEIYSLNRIKTLLFSQKLIYRILIKVIPKMVTYKKIKKYCENSQLIFASNHLVTETQSIANLFYKCAKDSNAIFVGIPLVPWTSWYQWYLFDFDYFLSSSKSEFQELKALKSESKILFLGCPPFEDNHYSSIDTKEDSNKMNKTQKTVLFIMVNTTNPIYVKYLDIYEDIRQFVLFLESRDYKCIIKLHPESLLEDKIKFKNIGISDSYFVYDSIESICSKVDIAITYLSTAILKCVARKVISFTYLPQSFLSSFPNNGEVYQQVYFTSKELDVCRLEDYCYKIETPDEIADIFEIENDLKAEYLLKNFQPENSSVRIIEYFNSVVENQEG
jgi:hypothetical protein